MAQDNSQIFQTNNPTRWQRFKWAGRIILVLALVALAAVLIALFNASLPDIPLEGRAIKKVLTEKIPEYRESKMGREYRGMRKFIEEKWAKGEGVGQKNPNLDLSTSSLFNDSLGIRAAFYVNWDPQSFLSLRRNINKVNLVLPEWFFIDPKSDTLIANIDKKGFDVIKAAKVKVMPILSNNYNSVFSGAALHRILNNKAKKDRLIADVLKLIIKYKFAGINVDFEELKESNNETLNNFQKELYTTLHANGFMVTQNVSPFNEDYDYKRLSNYNDYIFLMAYDEHSESTGPGPISGQRWIEAAVDHLAKVVPAKKIVLNIAAYGYDWKNGKVENTPLTYQQALVTARESDGIVDFDNDSYNLHYQYYDEHEILHEVHFTDAATNFNTLRFATEYGLAGTAIWRLGAEDNRLWDFYNLPMTKQALRKFDFNEFSKVTGLSEVDFMGQGEILDVVSTPKDGNIKCELDSADMVISEENYVTLPSSYVVKKWGYTSKPEIVLTYDDGPDPKYTKQILDTLAYYNVKASFFLVGLEAEKNIPLVKRIFREGHEIGNHTFTHPDMSAVGNQRALLEMDATRLLIECITGHSTILFRAPFNADYEPQKHEEIEPVALSRSRNYITVGEGLDPEDWQKGLYKNFTADTIFNRVKRAYDDHLASGDSVNIILLHDAGGDRSQTVLATGMLIRYFKAKGYEFTTVANLLGKKTDEIMPPVPHGNGYYLLQVNYAIAEIGYLSGYIFYALFLVFMLLSAIRLLTLGVLAIIQKKKEQRLAPIMPTPLPLVSIIVPAYNEEVNIIDSLNNLLKCDYANFNIIFVDDGSKDTTWQKVNNAFGNHPIIKLYTKVNGGKASALNLGIAQTNASYVVCIDADTKLAQNAVSKLMENFFVEKTGNEKEVGAVAGIVKVGNEVNILTKWQSIEYITSQNFDRKGFAYANAITVVPGAIGAFKKQAIIDAGGFTTDTLAEDCDLTIRIIREGYTIANEPRAIAYTEAPETVKQFMKQRYRWSFGVMQTFYKHRDLMLNVNHRSLGFIAMPDILLFKYIIPFFTPLADLLMLIGLLTDNAKLIGLYYILFTIVDAAIAALSFLFDKENPTKLIWLIPQRIIYRWLMMIVLFRSFKRAIKGELQHWGVLKRTGNVKMVREAK
ncbi:polysaccharide deacetylase family protein [Parasediminibacterium paludis]|uniref:Polysaccharide deacetylase family protein n=1 Tax=Parasediminibacterium paludis TaxID=908966 RepID=A0ABV8PYG2_9BACT